MKGRARTIVIHKISKREAERRRSARKVRLKLVEWNELTASHFPTRFTATVDYLATGEGQTVGIVMGQASDLETLQKQITEAFGAYLASGAELTLAHRVSPTAAGMLVPEWVRRLVKRKRGMASFHFRSLVHIG